jgi:hypothetical protein
MSKERIFVEAIDLDGDIQVTIVDERGEPSITYVDDKVHVTVYTEMASEAGLWLYIGMAIALISNQ